MLTNTDSLMTTFALHWSLPGFHLVQYIAVHSSYSLQLFWLHDHDSVEHL